MGLRLKRKEPMPTAPPSNERLARMSDDDLYLMLESALMNAQQRCSDYRSTPRDSRGAILAWLQTEVAIAAVAAGELTHRW